VSSGWTDRAEATKGLQQQAGGLAEKLGHRLGTWRSTWEADTSVARCQDCGDLATVRARSFRAPTISGAAVGLQCLGPIATQRAPIASPAAGASRASPR